MNLSHHVVLVCKQCKHFWKNPKTGTKNIRCPKCNSRKVTFSNRPDKDSERIKIRDCYVR
jgi:Zn finger protein HypA/HybF involved in hydrogenase expression